MNLTSRMTPSVRTMASRILATIAALERSCNGQRNIQNVRASHKESVCLWQMTVSYRTR